MTFPQVATGLTAGALVAHVAPAAMSIAPLRRAVAPGLSGVGSSGHIALTFDDGPDPASTPHFLDLLAKHDVRATFFLLGAYCRANAALLRRMVDEGHEPAVHGWNHRTAATLGPVRLRRELGDARHAIEDACGVRVRWYRPPYGVLAASALWACSDVGLRPVLWTAWGRDWERSATPARVVRTVVRALRPGGTILLHDSDRQARGVWHTSFEATSSLLSGPLAGQSVGPLADHFV